MSNEELAEEGKLTPKEVLENPANFVCTCRFTNCPIWGQCAKCTAVHKYYKVLTGCMENFTQRMD
jgi:hypothetical protein